MDLGVCVEEMGYFRCFFAGVFGGSGCLNVIKKFKIQESWHVISVLVYKRFINIFNLQIGIDQRLKLIHNITDNSKSQKAVKHQNPIAQTSTEPKKQFIYF